MRQRLRSALLLLALSALVPAPARAQGAEVWYAQTLTTGDAGLRVIHYWSKGRKLRSEMVVVGRPIVTVVNGEHYYAVDVLTGRGVDIRRSPAALAADARGGRPFGNELERVKAVGGEKIRSERLGGRKCDVYRVTDPKGRREVWIAEGEAQLPIRIEVFDRKSSITVRTDFVDWSRDVALPDSFFEPSPQWTLEQVEYEDYARRSAKEPVGPVPVLFGDLLHGR